MSEMIQCDKCKKLMYADSRSDRDAYCKINITYVDGYSTIHLCKTCHRQLLTEFFRTLTPEEYDDNFGGAEENG